jgi:hypothetical protein
MTTLRICAYRVQRAASEEVPQGNGVGRACGEKGIGTKLRDALNAVGRGTVWIQEKISPFRLVG